MKITVRKKEPEVKRTLIKDVPIGYVFKILEDEYNDSGPTALKLGEGKFILLTYSFGDEWLVVGESCWNDYLVRIIGELTEIIVEE